MFISLLRTLLKAYLSSALLKLVNGLRVLMIFVVVVIMSAMMCCVSGFAGIAYMIYQYKISGGIIFDGLLIFCSITFVISLLIFLKLMCKKYWIKVLKIDLLQQGL